MVIFTEAIALELLAKGFKLEYKTKKAWVFEDSAAIEKEINKIIKKKEGL